MPRPTWRVTVARLTPSRVEGGEEALGEMEAGRRAGRRAHFARIDRLVALLVLGVVLAPDVGRQGHVADALEVVLGDGRLEGEEDRCRAGGRRALDAARADDLGRTGPRERRIAAPASAS